MEHSPEDCQDYQCQECATIDPYLTEEWSKVKPREWVEIGALALLLYLPWVL